MLSNINGWPEVTSYTMMISGKLILQKHWRATTGSHLHLYTGGWPEVTKGYLYTDGWQVKVFYIKCNISSKIDDRLVLRYIWFYWMFAFSVVRIIS